MKKFQKSGSIFEPDKITSEILIIEEKLSQPFIWNDPEKSKQLGRKLSNMKNRINKWNEVVTGTEDTKILIELAEEEDIGEVEQELAKITEKINDLELSILLSGEHDLRNAIFSIHSGAGGVDAQDWAEMLLRMYIRYFERKSYDYKILDIFDGDEAGIKNAVILVKGDFAYGKLRAENGVHRLVRLSPFDAAHRRHTSFAQVEVMPEIDDDIEIEILPEDLKIDTYRASGAGGQHVNKTDSAVRIQHLPSGTIVQCQNERSQHSNRLTAMKILKSKLYLLQKAKKEKELAQIKGLHKDIAWGNQIRSYVIHPYALVKDHRTGDETGNVQAVFDGDIDRFIDGYLRFSAKN